MDQTTACAEQPSARSIATNEALALLKAELAAGGPLSTQAAKALATVADRCGYGLIHYDNEDDEDSSAIDIDEHELDEARARAARGEIEDALIHLGRALPAEYAIITDRAADLIRST